jgi:hypothetical protein
MRAGGSEKVVRHNEPARQDRAAREISISESQWKTFAQLD